MDRYEIETEDGLFVASSTISREDAVAKARAKAPNERFIGIIVREDGSEKGGFFVGNVPF